MSGTKQCEKFVRNAWKKELCSNCFKSKEEHSSPKIAHIAREHPPLPDPPKEGILKANKKNPSPKNNKVIFSATEFEVIGYGGDDVYSDDDDEPDFGDEKPAHEEGDTEEDKALQRLTKTNTDFNSVPANLQEPKPGENKQIVEPLRLGRQLVDDTGKKKTLVVSVTPFGGASVNTTPRVRTHSKPLEAKEKIENGTIELVEKKKENGEAKVLETAISAEVQPPKVVTEVGIKRSQPLDKNSKFRPIKEANGDNKSKELQLVDKVQEESRVNIENKLNEKLSASEKVANLLDKAKKKVHHLPVIGDPQNFKFKSTDFTTNKKAIQEANKAVVLDMYDLRIETKIENNLEKTELALTEETVPPNLISETENKSETSSPIIIADLGCSENLKLEPNVSSLHRNRPRTVLAPSAREEINEVKFDVVVNTETDVLPKINCSNEIQSQDEVEVNKVEKLEGYEGIIEDEEVTLFSVPSKDEERCAPDGRADSDILQEVDEVAQIVLEPSLTEEAPALPTSPPPIMDPRTSFLHSLTNGTRRIIGEKPKVPTKPANIQNKKHLPNLVGSQKSSYMEPFTDSPVFKPHPPLSETLSDSVKKRPAPKPPSPNTERSPPMPQHTILSDIQTSPIRIPRVEPSLRVARSTENILDLSHDTPLGKVPYVDSPDPSPRRSLSLSQDSLLNSGVSDVQAKKKSNRGRFSLRKLLHFGKSKDGTTKEISGELRHVPVPTSPKPKPEIIHPLDLTGTRVEVVPQNRTAKSRRTSSSASSSSGENRDSDTPSDSSISQSVSSSGNSANESPSTLERSRKPPPPPRNHSLEHVLKPARPPPPKNLSEPKKEDDDSPLTIVTSQRPRDNMYVNLGEARIGLAPNKPVRTGSLREVDGSKKLSAASEKQLWTGSLRHGFSDGCKKIIPNVGGAPEDSGYESFDVSLTTTDSQTSSLTGDDNVYECVQAPGELRSACSPRGAIRGHRRSEGNVQDVAQDYIKFRFLRSVSVPYCASEAESDIYSPYSFCGSEMGEEEYEWSPTSGRFQKVSRLKTKKGRSVVHKSLEDNYGAVVIANHEALTQVVEQMHQGPVTPIALRNLNSVPSLRWSDFNVLRDVGGVVVERRVFYPALWGVHPVTVCVGPEQSLGTGIYGKTPFSLIPLTELHDLVPSSYLTGGVGGEVNNEELVQSSISVFCRLQVDTLLNYSNTVNTSTVSDDIKKEINFVLLQIINALKTLQAQGIEEVPKGLKNMVVTREERDPHPRVCLLPLPGPEKDCTSLCGCILDLITNLPATELSSLLIATLREEKAVSLSQAKVLLEFTLWGPADIAWSGNAREPALQRWLDLERATVLQGLVRTRADLTVFEVWHLLFLVRTNAKMMAEASLLLEAQASAC